MDQRDIYTFLPSNSPFLFFPERRYLRLFCELVEQSSLETATVIVNFHRENDRPRERFSLIGCDRNASLLFFLLFFCTFYIVLIFLFFSLLYYHGFYYTVRFLLFFCINVISNH